MENLKDVVKKRFDKIEKHYNALRDYKNLIDRMTSEKNIFNQNVFRNLKTEEKAVLDAYLKRFASLQDFLGAKIFPSILEIAGIGGSKMSEVLYNIEKEGVIDSLGNWIELRETRNNLEHDYPDQLQEALDDLRYCVDNFNKIESYYLNSIQFVTKYIS